MFFSHYQKDFADLPGFVMLESLAVWDFFLGFQSETWKPGSLLEIGVYYGKSAMMLALHRKHGETIFLIDPADCVQSVRELLVKHNMSDYSIIQARSSENESWGLASKYAHTLRWIHVDGDHKAESVWNDLSLANILLSDTGIISVDDFFNPRYPQLTYVTCQFLEQHRAVLQLFFCGYYKAYLARPNAISIYLRKIREDLATAMTSYGFSDFTIYKTDYPNVINAFSIMDRWEDYVYHGLDEDPKKILY